MAFLLGQDYLMASFGDREALDKEDVAVIRELGLRFRGPMNWPQLRSHRPGYFPWHVTGREARFLAVALRQAAVVSRRARKDPSILWDGASRSLHRIPEGVEPTWRDELREDPGPLAPPRGVLPDPASARRDVVAARRLPGERWEVEVLPARVRAETRQGRPYVVHLALWVDQGARGMMRYEMLEPDDVPRAVPVTTHDLIGLIGAPEAVLVTREEVRSLLEPLLEGTGVGLEVVPRLPGVERARALVNERTGKNRPIVFAHPRW